MIGRFYGSFFWKAYLKIYLLQPLTIDHALPGRDNKFAILSAELKELTDFILIREQSYIDHGMRYQEIEESSRKFYRGRFSKSEL